MREQEKSSKKEKQLVKCHAIKILCWQWQELLTSLFCCCDLCDVVNHFVHQSFCQTLCAVLHSAAAGLCAAVGLSCNLKAFQKASVEPCTWSKHLRRRRSRNGHTRDVSREVTSHKTLIILVLAKSPPWWWERRRGTRQRSRQFPSIG